MELSTEQLLQKIKQLEQRLEESDQLIDAIKAGEVDAFALTKDNHSEIFTLESGDYAYRMLVENFGEGALNLSEESLIVYTNNYFLRLLNLKYNDVIGKPFSQFINQDYLETFNQLFRKGLTGQSKGEIVLTVGKKNIPIYISLSSLYPKLPTVGMVLTDLSQKKKDEKVLEAKNKELLIANQELTSREKRLQIQNELLEERKDFVETLINSSMDLIMVFDHEYRFLMANKMAQKRFNIFYKHNILGKKLTEVVPGIPLHDIELALKGQAHTVPITKSVISEKCYEVNYVPLLKRNEVYAAMVITHDITERIIKEEEIVQKNDELEKKNKELQSFAYISSHDLQEPLRKIQIFASRILEKEHDILSANGKDYFKRMQDAAHRMQTLITDLLAYSRTNTGDRNFERVDLYRIIEEVKIDLTEDLKDKNAILELQEMSEIYVIPFQFRQLLHNLIGNSLKFSNPNQAPHIMIKSRIEQGDKLNIGKLVPSKKYCHITLSDNGIGFDPQFSEKIFEVFQRLHNQSEYLGTGIGLSIVQKIIDNHNGFISATGIPNQGATFDIYIPEG